MQFTDKTLECGACSQPFIFTADEQRFFFEKQFTNIPKRCKTCRAKRSRSGAVRTPLETKVTCSVCQAETTVPFKPTQGRPVLCRACFQIAPKAGSVPPNTQPASQ